MNRKSKIMGRHAMGGLAEIFLYGHRDAYQHEYPPYLADEYAKDYASCTPKEFGGIVMEEVDACQVVETEIIPDYELWFGKYKGKKLHEITDKQYLQWLCDTQRKKNKKLVGQALLRLDKLQKGYWR